MRGRFFSRLARRLRARRGITLVETLAAALVLLLLGLMLNTGLLLARRGYDQLTAEAETRTLLSTLTAALSQELRYAREVETYPNGALASYTSTGFDEGTALELDLVTGRLTAGGQQLLPPGAYGNGDCRLDAFSVTYHEASGLFTVTLAVSDRRGVENETTFTVRCLNAGAAGSETEGGEGP